MPGTERLPCGARRADATHPREDHADERHVTSTLSARWMPVNCTLCVAATELRIRAPPAAATCRGAEVRTVPGPAPRPAALRSRSRHGCQRAPRPRHPVPDVQRRQGLGLTMIYRPQKRLVEATVKPSLHMRKGFVSEAGVEPSAHPLALSSRLPLSAT